MTKAIIVANGTANLESTVYDSLFASAAVVIAADGGANALVRSKRPIHVIVGDMDSVEPAILDDWERAHGKQIMFPAAKDETDLELAILHAVASGATDIVILGALGARPDHMLANILLLVNERFAYCQLAIVDDGTRVMALDARNGPASLAFTGHDNDTFSLEPLSARVTGLKSTGLQYALDSDELILGSPRGVSNVFIEEHVTVSCLSGVVIAMHLWKDHRPFHW